MAEKALSIRKRLGFSLVGLFTISFGILLIATDQVIKRDRLQRHERLVMATAMAVAKEIEEVRDEDGLEKQSLDEQSYRKILNEYSATRVLLWLSRPQKDPIFPNSTPIDQFFGNPKLLQAAGLNASGMQKPRSFNFEGQTYFTCSLPLPGEQGVLRFLEDVGVSPAGRKENLIALILFWFISTLIATILVRQIMTRSLNPLVKLENVMDEISLRPSGLVSDGQIISSSQPIELEGIVTSYNRLAERLQESWTKQLLFMRSMSHELITPLTLIGSSARRLDRRVQGLTSEERDLLSSIRNEAWNADHIVRDLIDLARGESGNLHLNLKSLAAVDIIKELSNELKPLPWGGRVLTPTLDDLMNLKSIEIEVNPDRLRQSIINVLENASKYSPSSKPIELSMLHVNDNICFDVRDFGSGIPEEEFETIFQPFRRGELASNGIPGSGVGLALVYQLVKLMNGRIYVLRSSNEGTVMRFEFPVVSYS
jgi:signal transduction histidine kinase